jgi:hypothetical protein
LIINILTTITGLLVYLNQELKGRESSLINCINVTFEKNVSDEKNHVLVRLKTRINVVFVFTICLLVALTGNLCFYVLISKDESFNKLFKSIMGLDFRLFKLTYFVSELINQNFLYMSLSLYCMHSMIVNSLFDHFNREFDNSFFNKQSKANLDMNTLNFYRIWYIKLCSMVKKLDKCYATYICINVTVYSLMILSMLYLLADSSCSIGANLKKSLPFQIVWMAVLLLVIVGLASRINQQVCASFLKNKSYLLITILNTKSRFASH